MADSRFNAEEIAALGHANPQVLPLVLDFSMLRAKPDRRILRQYRDGMVNVLFVGRCAPNKRIEDLLNAFYYFQRYVQPASRLIHVGSYAGMEQYHALLLTRMRELQLKNVELVGSVRQDELNAYYEVSRAFLCLSDHEGFCIPLLEAMTHDVPVVAYAAGAVPETLDGAGVLVREKRYDLIAEVLGRVAEDEIPCARLFFVASVSAWPATNSRIWPPTQAVSCSLALSWGGRRGGWNHRNGACQQKCFPVQSHHWLLFRCGGGGCGTGREPAAGADPAFGLAALRYKRKQA
jgi:glycosyltransferase involved in cell wall biosynthesis